MISLLPVQAADVDKVWSRIEGILQQAVEQFDGFSMADVFYQLKTRQWQLWLVVDEDNAVHAAVVTSIDVYPRKKTCLIRYLAGEGFENWQHLQRDIEQWARQNGCKDMELRGRRGWQRMAGGYMPSCVIMNKNLET